MATYYIDPTAAGGGSGSEVSPFRAFADLPALSAGDSVLRRRGTSAVDALALSGVVASAANPVTFDAYGLGPLPIVDAGGGLDASCFEFTGCTGFVVKNHELLGATDFPAGGVRAIDCDDVIVSACDIHDTYYGVRSEVTAATAKSGLTVSDCEIRDTADSWILAIGSTVSGGTYSNIDILRNVMERSGRSGISIQSRDPGTEVTSPYAVYNVNISHNDMDTTAAYGAFLKGVWSSANLYGQNKFHNNRLSNTGFGGGRDTHAIWHGGNKYWTIDYNTVVDAYVFDNNTIGSGVGLFIDVWSSTQGCQYMIARKNRFHRCGRGNTLSIIGGAAIGVLRSSDLLIAENLGTYCRNGIFVQGTTSAPDTIRVDVQFNTMAYNNADGSAGAQYAAFAQAKIVRIRNNVGIGGKLGLYKQTVSGAVTTFTESHNAFYGQTVQAIGDGNGTFLSPGSGTSPAASDLLSDPRLDDNYRPRFDSPLLGAGTHLGYVRDLDGKQRPRSPSIGAYDLAYLRTAPRTY